MTGWLFGQILEQEGKLKQLSVRLQRTEEAAKRALLPASSKQAGGHGSSAAKLFAAEQRAEDLEEQVRSLQRQLSDEKEKTVHFKGVARDLKSKLDEFLKANRMRKTPGACLGTPLACLPLAFSALFSQDERRRAMHRLHTQRNDGRDVSLVSQIALLRLPLSGTHYTLVGVCVEALETALRRLLDPPTPTSRTTQLSRSQGAEGRGRRRRAAAATTGTRGALKERNVSGDAARQLTVQAHELNRLKKENAALKGGGALSTDAAALQQQVPVKCSADKVPSASTPIGKELISFDPNRTELSSASVVHSVVCCRFN